MKTQEEIEEIVKDIFFNAALKQHENVYLYGYTRNPLFLKLLKEGADKYVKNYNNEDK